MLDCAKTGNMRQIKEKKKSLMETLPRALSNNGRMPFWTALRQNGNNRPGAESKETKQYIDFEGQTIARLAVCFE